MQEDQTPPSPAPEPEAQPPTAPEPVATAAPRANLLRWIAAGLRASVLLEPRITATPTPWQLALLVLLPDLVGLYVGRFALLGAAQLHASLVLNHLWALGFLFWLGWWAFGAGAGSGRLARWFVLFVWSAFPANLLATLLSIPYAQGWPPSWAMQPIFIWIVFGLLYAWLLLATTRLTAREVMPRWRPALFLLGLVAFLGLSVWQMTQTRDRVWQPDQPVAAEEPERPSLELSQEVFEAQQALTARTLAGIAERQPGHANVYGLVFAPYASEDVFLRESNMVTALLEERFDAKGRVVHLMNHATTTGTLPWATPQNLERSLAALSKVMDRDNDLLVVYLTSHGARDHKLAAEHWPLTVPWLTPEELRKALDDVGIRHRVVAISACFSGGWIEPLASDDTLVMTAADAEHTSYGCGRLSELTFFGRAMFDEELRKTHSFETAFKAAVPLIQQREIDAHKEDGFSNPQIRVGEKIRPLLDQLAQRLDAAGK